MARLNGKPARARNTGWLDVEGKRYRVLNMTHMANDMSWSEIECDVVAVEKHLQTNPMNSSKAWRWRKEAEILADQFAEGNGVARVLVERADNDTTPAFVAKLERRPDGRLGVTKRWDSGFIPALLKGDVN